MGDITGDITGDIERGTRSEAETTDQAPVVTLITGLIGALTDDEAALVRTLTPPGATRSTSVEHLFDLVDVVSTIRYDEAMAEYVYAIAPSWDGTVEMLLLAARVTTAVTRAELERSVTPPGARSAARQPETV